jgi:hypothetical protein
MGKHMPKKTKSEQSTPNLQSELLVCGACGRRCEVWQNDRCPTCESLHINNKLAKFNLTIKLDVAIKTLLKDKSFEADYIHKLSESKIDLLDISEAELRSVLSLQRLSQPVWNALVDAGEYKIGFLVYTWGKQVG